MIVLKHLIVFCSVVALCAFGVFLKLPLWLLFLAEVFLAFKLHNYFNSKRHR